MPTARDLLAACCEHSDAQRQFDGLVEGYINGRVIGAGTDVMYMRLEHDSTHHARDSVYHTFDRVLQTGDLTVRLCYCSVLDQCWLVASGADGPQPIASCTEERTHPQYH